MERESLFPFRPLQRIDALGHKLGVGKTSWFRRLVCDPYDLSLGTPDTPENFPNRWTPESRRIANHTLLEAIEAVWAQVPDQRFGQFVMNLSRTEQGFADTWEWNHGTWHSVLAHAQETWARAE